MLSKVGHASVTACGRERRSRVAEKRQTPVIEGLDQPTDALALRYLVRRLPAMVLRAHCLENHVKCVLFSAWDVGFKQSVHCFIVTLSSGPARWSSDEAVLSVLSRSQHSQQGQLYVPVERCIPSTVNNVVLQSVLKQNANLRKRFKQRLRTLLLHD